MDAFRQLMWTGVELQRKEADQYVSCVLFVDSPKCQMLFCGPRKNTRDVTRYRMANVTFHKINETELSIQDNRNETLILNLGDPNVRDYIYRMFQAVYIDNYEH
jgi:hypothetical protein